MAETAAQGPWAEKLAGVQRDGFQSPQELYDLLIPSAMRTCEGWSRLCGTWSAKTAPFSWGCSSRLITAMRSSAFRAWTHPQT
jgi:hypothetical protein